MRLNYFGYRFASPALALLWTIGQRVLPSSSFKIVPIALTHSRRSLHCVTHNILLPSILMPQNKCTTRATKRAISISKEDNEPAQNELPPKKLKRVLQKSVLDEENDDISVNNSQTKAVPTSTKKTKTRKTLITPVNNEEVETKTQPKKAAAPKHQVLTDVDQLPKLWNTEEHKDSYSECFFCLLKCVRHVVTIS